MPFDGYGTFIRLRSWIVDATNSVKIRADFHDDEDNGFAEGLSHCITKDGQTAITQNIPFNSRRIISLADPIDPQDAATKDYADTKMPLDGSTPITGDVTIDNADPAIILDGDPGGFGNSIQGKISGKMRWLLRLGNGVAETGGNAGSDFDIYRYADDGSIIAQVLNFNRATGLGVVAADPTAALGIATKQYTDTASNAAAASANTRVLRAGDTMTGMLRTNSAIQGIGGTGPMGTLEVMGNQPGITFHSPGVFATNFGMAADGNFYMGGFSHSGATYKFWTTRDFDSTPGTGVITNARLVVAGGARVPEPPDFEEPFNGGVTTSLRIGRFADGRIGNIDLLWRYLQLYTTSWWTVSYG